MRLAHPALDGQTGSPLRAVLCHRDVVAGMPAGAAVILLGYYLLLAQVTSVHTLVARLPIWPAYMWGLAMLAPLAVGLFALNFAVLGLLVRARARSMAPAGTFLGALIGGFGAACPGCGAFLLSAVGVSAGLSALPFAGLELWTASVAVMAVALAVSARRLQSTCRDADDGCRRLPPPSRRHLLSVAAIVVHEPW